MRLFCRRNLQIAFVPKQLFAYTKKCKAAAVGKENTPLFFSVRNIPLWYFLFCGSANILFLLPQFRKKAVLFNGTAFLRPFFRHILDVDNSPKSYYNSKYAF